MGHVDHQYLQRFFSSFPHGTFRYQKLAHIMMLEGGSPIFKQSQHKSFYSFPKKDMSACGLAPPMVKYSNVFTNTYPLVLASII
jgi:hypothetical protein